MTDINKQIEEEAREYRRKLIQKIRLNKANVDYILENGLINGSLMLDIDKAMIDYQKHSSRWRKVSEEDPQFTDEFTTINVKSSKGNISTMNIHSRFKDVYYKEVKQYSIIEWKYIN